MAMVGTTALDAIFLYEILSITHIAVYMYTGNCPPLKSGDVKDSKQTFTIILMTHTLYLLVPTCRHYPDT
jgi:hypothetical protein